FPRPAWLAMYLPAARIHEYHQEIVRLYAVFLVRWYGKSDFHRIEVPGSQAIVLMFTKPGDPHLHLRTYQTRGQLAREAPQTLLELNTQAEAAYCYQAVNQPFDKT
ncbi:hypothetical protein IWQ60_012611, partial [Tieghemiomyces parasiticus]